MATEFTLSDAKKYLNEAIKNWQEAGESQKIVKLAKWAEKWTVSRDRGDKEKMKILHTSINQTNAQIKRDAALGLAITAEEDKLKVYRSAMAELETKYGKYVPTKPKKKVVVEDVIK